MDDRYKPPPITVVLGNLVGAMPTNRMMLGERVLESMEDKLRRRGGGIGICLEADDARIRRVLDPDLYWWEHKQARFLDGVMIFGTRELTSRSNAEWRPGAPKSPVNDPRPILRVKIDVNNDDQLWGFSAGAMHRPKPKGGASAGATMDDRAKGANIDLLGTDGNRARSWMVDEYPMYDVHSGEVMHLLARRRLQVKNFSTFDLLKNTKMDDHPGLVGEVTLSGR